MNFSYEKVEDSFAKKAFRKGRGVNNNNNNNNNNNK